MEELEELEGDERREPEREPWCNTRKAFEDIKQKFCQQSQPGDAIVVSRISEAWLDPELALDSLHEKPWYKETCEVLRFLSAQQCTLETLRESAFVLAFAQRYHTEVTKGVWAACKLYLANMSWEGIVARLLDDGTYTYFIPVTLIERCWMSVARVAWMTAVVRGKIMNV